VTARSRRHGGRLETDIALAFVAGAAAFVLASVVSTEARSHVPGAVLAVIFLLAILAVAHYGGILYALPVGVVSIQAYDWDFLAPLRALDAATGLVLGLSLLMTALVGAVASHTSRRAIASEGARGLLADEQAALRRVATLVAQGVPPSELFSAVAQEVGALFTADLAGMVRYESDDTLTVAAAWDSVGGHIEVDGRWPLDGGDLAPTILRTGRSAGIDDYEGVPGRIAAFVREQLGVTSSVGSPIVVEGRLWGALMVHSKTGPLPADAEARLANFTDLVATAMANAQARAEVQRLADEQAALRRVATLVARESPPAQVFAAVAEELGRVLHVEHTKVFRYEPDATATIVADWGERDDAFPPGTRLTVEGDNLTALVLQTGEPARIDDYANVSGSIGAHARRLRMRSAVGAPIVVEGRVWGAMIAASLRAETLPADAESRIEEFTDLVATAISNVEARSDLAASRARIVVAADGVRRRVVRDLHDGAQQRLIHAAFVLQAALDCDDVAPDVRALVEQGLMHARSATRELRELAHGIHPAILTNRGLAAAVEGLADRVPLPVEVDIPDERYPTPVEATAYFVVAEALTNVAKHAHATRAVVKARVKDGTLAVRVRDDGKGGARPDGSGLVGLADRLAALDGQLRLESPADGGTLVAATIPLGLPHEVAQAGPDDDDDGKGLGPASESPRFHRSRPRTTPTG
jgi:signal transduction histidine kinase